MRPDAQDSAALSNAREVSFTSRAGKPHTAPHWLTSCLDPSFPTFFTIFFLFCWIVFKRNHFVGHETGIFPHIMHFNGYRWLSG